MQHSHNHLPQLFLLALVLLNSQKVRSEQENVLSMDCRGKIYFELVSLPSNITQALQAPYRNNDATDVAMREILAERNQKPEVFSDFRRYLSWVRSRFNPDTGTHPCRPGSFYGHIRWFLSMGPEAKHWSINALDENGGMVRNLTDHIFTDIEIEAGKLRNRAARMALLETIIKGTDNLGGYEQAEMVDVALDFWIRTSKPKDTDINVSAVLDSMAKSGLLHPIAMLHLGKEKYSQKELHEIYCRLLDDSMSPEFSYYYSYVKEAIEFLKTHYPQDLENAETKLSWKRAVIDEALGRQTNPFENAENTENQEIVIDVVL